MEADETRDSHTRLKELYLVSAELLLQRYKQEPFDALKVKDTIEDCTFNRKRDTYARDHTIRHYVTIEFRLYKKVK